MRVFATKSFARFCRRERIDERRLCEAVMRADHNMVDADLGGGVIKQRVARKGQGRSGGYRVLILYRARDRAVFLYGFAKSERENIDRGELERLRRAAVEMLGWNDRQVAELLAADEWMEIRCP